MDISSIIAAIIPSAMFLFLILYYTVWKGGGYAPKIVKTKDNARFVALSTQTNDQCFIEDDLLLWKEFKRLKEKDLIADKKEDHSFVSIRMNPALGENNWEYMIGRIVSNFTNVPTGFKTVEIPPQCYVTVHLNVKNEESWGPSVLRLEKYVCEKWLPNTKYEINPDSKVRAIVYHDKRGPKTTRTIIYYLAVKEKNKAVNQ